jgi:hypothetical protein
LATRRNVFPADASAFRRCAGGLGDLQHVRSLFWAPQDDPDVVNFRCERWQTPEGDVMTAPLPAGINSHFGPELRRFVLAQYHQGQMTVPRLVTLLRSLGIFISKRQVGGLLIGGQDGFLAEARDVLRAGLVSDWLR